MEVLFENEFSDSKQLYSDLLFYYYFMQPRRLILNGLLTFLFLFCVILFENPILKILMAVLIVFYWVITLFRFSRDKKIRYMQELEINNGEPAKKRFSVTENSIETLNITSGGERIIPLAEVKRVVKTKHFYFIVTKSLMLYPFSKDHFTKGTAEEFLAFFRNRGYKC